MYTQLQGELIASEVVEMHYQHKSFSFQDSPCKSSKILPKAGDIWNDSTCSDIVNSKKSSWLILTKFGTKHPWVKRIQVYSNEGPHPFLGRK